MLALVFAACIWVNAGNTSILWFGQDAGARVRGGDVEQSARYGAVVPQPPEPRADARSLERPPTRTTILFKLQ